MDNQEPLNLSALGMDLAASLLPDWAKESSSQPPSVGTQEPATREGKGSAFPREGREPPFSRTQQKGRFAARRRAETQQKGFGKERGQARDGQFRKKESRRGSFKLRSKEDREDVPDAELAGWQITFLPDPRGVEGLAAQIRATARAYPVFELAKLVLESPRRYDVNLTPKPDASSLAEIYQFRFDKTLWMSEGEAIRHALRSARKIFYRSEEVEVEPPKGNFQCIAEVDGILLCPPNYHEYPEKLRVLHEQKYAKMPFQTFKARVRMLRDEQALEQWKKSASRREVFRPLPLEAIKALLSGESTKPAQAHCDQPLQSGAEEAVVAVGGESANENPGDSQSVGEPVRSGDGSSVNVSSAHADETNREPMGGDVVQEATGESAVSNADVQVAAEAPVSEHSTEPAITNESDLLEHFRKSFAQLAIERVTSEVVIPGTVAELSSCAEISRAVKAARFKLTKFPLQMAQMIAQKISSFGLPVFKAHRKILYVSIARPKPIDPARVGEPLRKLLELLEKNPRTPRSQLMKILFESRPIPEGSDAAAREAAVRADLAWLIREGHVVDYAMRGIQVIKAKASGNTVAEKSTDQTPNGSGQSPVAFQTLQIKSLDAGPVPDAPAATAMSATTGDETGTTGEIVSTTEILAISDEVAVGESDVVAVGESDDLAVREGVASNEKQAPSDEAAGSFETAVPAAHFTVPYLLEPSTGGQENDHLLDSVGTETETSLLDPTTRQQEEDPHATPFRSEKFLATNATPEPTAPDLAESESLMLTESPIEDSPPASSLVEPLVSEVPLAAGEPQDAEASGAKIPVDLTDTENRDGGVVSENS